MELIFYRMSPNCRKALAVIKQLNLDVTLTHKDIPKGEHATADITGLNPTGKLPILKDGSFTLWNSNAIMQYLSEKAGDEKMFPKNDPQKSAEVAQWLFWQSCDFGPATEILTFENLAKEALFGMGAPDPVKVQEGNERFAKTAKVLDNHLQGRKFVCGEDLTIADYSLASWLAFYEPSKIPLKDYSNLFRWFNDVASTPGWINSDPEKV